MSRLPFNPAAMRVKARASSPSADSPAGPSDPGAPPTLPREPANISVSQLAAMIDQALRDQLPGPVRVIGEISQFRSRTHWYFDLKDASALVSCVMWKSAARKVGFVPEPGQQVVVSGRVEFYPPQGRTQFIADRLEPVGAGALDLAFRKLVDELRALGYFDDSRKRALPLFPRRLAIITSASGAALQDVLDTLRRRCPSLPVGLVDVRVQGDGAAEHVASALERLGAHAESLDIDVVLITRGGGSREDLAAFNDRALAEAIVRCPIPVVCAIGHETDTTIAELVADLRGATPTQAVMHIAPDAAALHRQLDSLALRLTGEFEAQLETGDDRVRRSAQLLQSSVRTALLTAARRMDNAALRLERMRPAAEYARRSAALDLISQRLAVAIRTRLDPQRLDDAALRLQAAAIELVDRGHKATVSAARALDLVGPSSVLRRGYSVTLSAGGNVVRSMTDVAPGEQILTRVADGAFASIVGSSGGDHHSLPLAPKLADAIPPAPRTRRILSSRRGKLSGISNTPTLFGS
jgi:exodeoxyribonuclease VII large subunit